MFFSAQHTLLAIKRFVDKGKDSHKLAKVLGLCLLATLIVLEFAPFSSFQAAAQQAHTVGTVDASCSQISYSSDGNPFPLCPGNSVTGGGGNCVWWAWEQWHLLGYNLPDNWGNAADWIVDAERAGLPIGTTPRLGSLAVFPRADGVWAFGTAGHVAFVTAVSSDSMSFNVTYEDYGDPTYMYTGTGYSVPVINQPNYQDGGLRFIYFPRDLSVTLLAKLPGMDSAVQSTLTSAVAQTNAALAASNASNTTTAQTNSSAYGAASTTSTNFTSDRVALGLTPTSTDQQFNADFTGRGDSDLLLYNRARGDLSVFSMDRKKPVEAKNIF